MNELIEFERSSQAQSAFRVNSLDDAMFMSFHMEYSGEILTDEVLQTDLNMLNRNGCVVNVFDIGRRFLRKEQPLYKMISNCKSIIDFIDVTNMLINELWFPNVVDKSNVIRAVKMILERYRKCFRLSREFLHECYLYWMELEDEVHERTSA
jgi:hypothetical protein